MIYPLSSQATAQNKDPAGEKPLRTTFRELEEMMRNATMRPEPTPSPDVEVLASTTAAVAAAMDATTAAPSATTAPSDSAAPAAPAAAPATPGLTVSLNDADTSVQHWRLWLAYLLRDPSAFHYSKE